MASRSAIESWPGFETSQNNGLRVLNKDLTRFLSRRGKKGSAGRVFKVKATNLESTLTITLAVLL